MSRRPCWDPADTNGKCTCPDKVRIYRADGGKRLLIPCNRRTCAHCGPWHWRRRVLAGLHAGLRAAPGDEFLAVLLTAPGDVGAAEFNGGASQAWHRFTTYLRRAYPGAPLDYWRVAELQDRGHVHFHVVVRGLKFLGFCRTRMDRIRDRRCCGKRDCLRQIALMAGFGAWVGVRRPRDYPGGVRSLGWYFSKYLLKEYGRDVGVTKLVTFSHGWRAGWTNRQDPSTGKWIYAGPVGAPWKLLGTILESARAERVPEWRAPWWRSHWRVARGREAASDMAWAKFEAPVVFRSLNVRRG